MSEERTEDTKRRTLAQIITAYEAIPIKDRPHQRQQFEERTILERIAHDEESFVNTYRANECLSAAIELIFAGTIPNPADYQFLLAEINRYNNPRAALWEFCAGIAAKIYPHAPQPPNTTYANELASILTDKWPTGKHPLCITIDMTGFHSVRRANATKMSPYQLTLWLLTHLFPECLLSFLNKLLQQGAPLTAHDLAAFAPMINHQLATQITPYDFDALAWITERFGQQLDGAYLKIATRVHNTDVYSDVGDHLEPRPIENLFNSLTGAQTAITIKKARSIFPFSIEVAQALIEAPNTPQPIMTQAFQYLASLPNYESCILGQPLIIPKDMSGATLCKFIIYLAAADIKNPKGMIKDLPSEEDLRSRTIELQLAQEHNKKLFTEALEAREKVQNIAGHGFSAKVMLHNALTNIVNSSYNMRNFFDTVMEAGIAPSHRLELVRFLFAVESFYRRSLANGTPYLCKRCVNCAALSADPPEKTAFQILEQLQRLQVLPQLQWAEDCGREPKTCTLSKKKGRADAL